MTCYVAIKLSSKFGIDLHNSFTTISKKASIIRGTSAKVKYGEVYSLWDLLFGLMLPSGNDAAIAIAEYFG